MDALIKNRTAIIALGDVSLRDAGTGQFLLELVGQLDLPDYVDIYNCGLNPECFNGDIKLYDRIVLLTAHKHGDAAGEILFTTIAADIENVLKGLPTPLQKTKDHLIQLFNRTIQHRDVEWILIGIEPKSVCPGASISDDVIKAAPKVLNFINDLLWESAHDKSLI
jgi:hydrogenase maturation protease